MFGKSISKQRNNLSKSMIFRNGGFRVLASGSESTSHTFGKWQNGCRAIREQHMVFCGQGRFFI
jgi:hypothetical protein